MYIPVYVSPAMKAKLSSRRSVSMKNPPGWSTALVPGCPAGTRLLQALIGAPFGRASVTTAAVASTAKKIHCIFVAGIVFRYRQRKKTTADL